MKRDKRPIISGLYSSVGQSDQSKRKPRKTKHDHDRGNHVVWSSSKKLKPQPPYSHRKHITKIAKKSKSRTNKNSKEPSYYKS